jgi:predicted TIM-barrel fold metal-dependent hydrolase
MDGETESGLLDHHVHGVVGGPLDRSQFELLMNEGGAGAPVGTSHFDSPVGLAVLARCGPVLGLAPDAGPDDYLGARHDLGPTEVNRRLLTAAGLDGLLVETGHRGGEVVGPQEMGALAGTTAWSVARIERVAEELAERSDGPQQFCAELAGALDDAAASSVGFKTIVAYRHGFDLDPAVPDRAEVRRASAEWFAAAVKAGRYRLDSPVILAHVLHTAIDVAVTRRIPVQVHAGFGDTDLTLHRADPSLFTPWVHVFGERGVDLLFLHCYPYHRQAGYLAAVYPHVYFDVGCMAHYTGASARTVVAEAMELAPWTKQLYSSDAFGLAEFAYLGALLFRHAISDVVRGWEENGGCPDETARQIRRLVSRDNARRVYRLDDPDQQAKETRP